MFARFFQRATVPPDSWQLELDPQDAERRKRERVIRLNTVVVPQLRAAGYTLVALVVLLHNALVFGDPGWDRWLRLVGAIAIYTAASWYLLYLFYADLRKYLDLGLVFLVLDLAMYSLAVYASGAERSWLFFLAVFRVVDQTPISTRRAVLFAHLAPLSYLGVLLGVIYIDHRPIAWAPEIAKLAMMYAVSVYTALVAIAADRRTQRMAQIIRVARQLVTELGQKSTALEESSRELRQSLETQSRLANENAMLYSNAQRDRTRQHQIFNSTSDGILSVRRDGRIEAANVRAGDLLGFDPASVRDMEVARVVSRLYSIGDGDSFLPTLHTLLADPFAGGQGDLQQPSTGRVLHWVAQPARDAAGEVSGLTFTLQDVTHQRDLMRQLEDKSKLLEDARARSEDANRAKGEFLANVSHEVRTPLSAIIGMAQHMLENSPRPDMLRRVRTSAESLMAIINDILDFSKIESRKLALEQRPFSVRDVLKDAAETLRVSASEKGLALELDVRDEVPDALVGDALRLRQVLLNLLGNALKFTERGEIRLRVGVASDLGDAVCLHFGVIDTGIGIPRDKQDVVFDAFSQADGSVARKHGGTGLGLSISTRLVEMMRGDIWVESEAGEGSTFRFTATFARYEGELPAAPTAAPVVETAAPSRGPLSVLIVEDDEVHRELLTITVKAAGHDVISTCNGHEALQELARRRIDVVLMDLQMPHVDGFKAATAIRTWERAAGGHLPIIAMSASALGEDQERCKAAGMDRFITKPIQREALFAAIEELRGLEGPAELPPELAGRPAFLSGLGDDIELARKLVSIFLEQSPRLMNEIRAAVAARDAQALRRAAHALKGTISNFPVGAARAEAAKMETFGHDGDLDSARAALPALEQEVERLQSLLPAMI